jgi:GNAT superfamily N-acetyltransferase
VQCAGTLWARLWVQRIVIVDRHPYAADVTRARLPRAEYAIEPLTPDTWEAFARLAERHNGVWGGCWCVWFHPDGPERKVLGNRGYKQKLVAEGRAHAALVFEGDTAVAWCEYGRVEELPNIYHRKEVEAQSERTPDYRLTCLFVDRAYRRKGVAAVAVRGALELISRAGGGLVEAYPQDTAPGQKVSASFLYNGTRHLFEQTGFSYDRPKGKNHCVMSKVIQPTTSG